MIGPPHPDYSVIDRAGVGRLIFYPRADASPPPPGATNIRVPVADGVSVGCRFFASDPSLPTILYFHGNGEVAADYDGIAPLYEQAGLNLFVADFRGYGASDGEPTFAALVEDAQPVQAAFHALLDERGFSAARFVMGRSLGSHPAIELAVRVPGRFRGLIVESGAANIARMMRFFSGGEPSAEVAGMLELHAAKLAAISLPTLVIHGEWDELIPVDHAIEFYDSLATTEKELVIIPGAGHNDIMWVGLRQYFDSLTGFVARHSP